MMTLRIIRNVWSYEKQSKNTQEIVRKAGALYDKLRLILEDMDALGKQIATANKTYESAYAKLATGKGNLVRQVEGFQELGAVVKKQIPSQILDQSED
jgi:DNA recombination protein RmuC